MRCTFTSCAMASLGKRKGRICLSHVSLISFMGSHGVISVTRLRPWFDIILRWDLRRIAAACCFILTPTNTPTNYMPIDWRCKNQVVSRRGGVDHVVWSIKLAFVPYDSHGRIPEGASRPSSRPLHSSVVRMHPHLDSTTMRQQLLRSGFVLVLLV